MRSAPNDGPDDATSVQLQNLVPDGTSFIGASVGGFDPVTGVWGLGTVPALSATILELTFQVLPGTVGDVIVDAISVLDLDQTDPDVRNNSDLVSFTVAALTDFAVTKSVDDSISEASTPPRIIVSFQARCCSPRGPSKTALA